MSSAFTAADYIDDHASESEDDHEEDSDSEQEDDEDSHEAMARALDRRDFEHMDRAIRQFESTGMIPPPTPSGGSVHSRWNSRSPSPFALAAAPDEPPPLPGSRAPTPLFLPGSPMSESPPAEEIIPDTVPPQQCGPHSRSPSPAQAMLVDNICREKSTRPRSESAAPSPPPKRQRTKHLSRKERIRKKALSFLDVDADDDDEDLEKNRDDGDDSEGEEDRDFVDDREPISGPRLPSIFNNCKTLKQEALENEAIAQYYVDKASSLKPARRGATPLRGDDDDKHCLRAVPPTPADVLNHPLYMFSVPPKTELSFIRHILMYPNIEHAVQSAFTRAIGSGAVCVETTDLKLLFQALKQYPRFVRNRTKPDKIDTLDSWFHVVFTTPPIEHIGHWRRLARPIGTLSKGDLVFVQDGATALGIPRIHQVDTDQAERPKPGEKHPPRTLGLPPSTTKLLPLPQRLFVPAQFRHQYPDRTLRTAKKPEHQHLFLWRKLVFRSDRLEHLSWNGDSRFFSPLEARPSETELKWFTAANTSNNVLVYSKQKSASGIIPLPEVKRLWPDIQVRPYLGTTCALQEGDSVVVRRGEYEGRIGQITRIVDKKRTLHGTGKGRTDKAVLVRYAAVQHEAATPITRLTIENESTFIVLVTDLALQALALVRPLIPDDRVKVVHGQEARGMLARILDIAQDGMVELQLEAEDSMVQRVQQQRRHLHMQYLQRDFRVSDVVNVVRGPAKGSIGFVLGVTVGGFVEFIPCDADCLKVAITYHYLAQDVSFSVPTADLQFLHIDKWYLAVPDAPPRRWSVEWEKAAERQPRLEFLDRVVFLVGHNVKFKGYYGNIVGYTQRNPNEEPEYLVQLEARPTQVAVKLQNMLDRDTKHPLLDDDLEDEPPRAQLPPWVPEDPIVEDAAWGTGGALIVPDIGEDTGVWLTRAEFVHKRIDVKILGVQKSKFPKLINSNGTRHEGRAGYLVPLSEPVMESTLRTKGIKIRVAPMSHAAAIPADALKPLRETPSNKSISEEKGRVIVIGPDVYGSLDRMGQYAETMPGESDHPEVVQVRFVKSASDTVSPKGLYAVKWEEPTVFLSQGRTLIEKTGPAKSSVQEFPADDDAFTTPSSPVRGTESPTKKRHHATRVTQDQAWQLDVLPALIPVFVNLWHKTRGLRDADALPLLGRTDCSCGSTIVCKISVVRFTVISDLEIDVCECKPAAQQLLAAGLFPSAPWRPTLAVDLRVLEFARTLFGKISPNNTAWTATMESFLTDLGFTLDHEGSLRRLFASALEWYTHLRNLVSRHFDRVIEDARQSYLEEKQEEQRAHDDDGPATPTVSAPMPTQERPRGRGVHRSASHAASTSPTPAPRAGQKRGREKTPPRENPFKPSPPLTRPSEYLCRRCPACFGALVHNGAVKMDFNVCLDVCFTQKRNTGGNDPPKFHPDTFFVPEDLSRQMEEHVDSIRDSKPSEKKQRKATVTEIEDEDDIYEHKDLKLPRSVLDGCEASFKAADENRQKASSQFYSDTGLMALLCRHDCVLWLVNMHSPGEKQFNVWLLLETLMQHLPLDVMLGVMYNIACQAERSARKWGFLSQYIHQLLFAVSVFHAFGHEWACQVIYHPLKCEGFGFSNGESAEHFWHLISHLIAHLRISGDHHHLYTLDNQVKQIDEANLFKLAEWIHRRTLFSKNKCTKAVRDLKKSGHSKEFLRQQWKEQVKSQTKPIPRRSKTRAEKAVAAVIELRNTVDAQKKEVRECKAAWNDAVEDGDDELLADTELALKDARAAVTKLKDRLLRSENALGIHEKSELKKLMKTKFFQLRFDVRVKKTRLHHLLRARKFEHEQAERSSHRQQSSDIKLRTHTQSAVKHRQPKITNLRTTPRGAISPQPIDAKKVFELDMDDSIWQDVGLEDNDDRGEPPLWLSSDSVRSGIQAVLQLDRTDEEDAMLAKETRSMRAWFIEEWDVLRLAVANAANEANRYQLFLHRERLLRLCARWRNHTTERPGDAPWGPSQAELMECLAQAQTAGRGEDRCYGCTLKVALWGWAEYKVTAEGFTRVFKLCKACWVHDHCNEYSPLANQPTCTCTPGRAIACGDAVCARHVVPTMERVPAGILGMLVAANPDPERRLNKLTAAVAAYRATAAADNPNYSPCPRHREVKSNPFAIQSSRNPGGINPARVRAHPLSRPTGYEYGSPEAGAKRRAIRLQEKKVSVKNEPL
ncbi:hypothetical protein K438DRAFT_1993154 [Mycena galopus ATCC 62051]|nr:hypothetical protein K438DRAFT_1993154 [Mycena galopus ATCC 62051]